MPVGKPIERELGLTAGQEKLRPVVRQTGVGDFLLASPFLLLAAAAGMETEASLEVPGKRIYTIRRRAIRRVRDVIWRPVVDEAVDRDAGDEQRRTSRHTATTAPDVTQSPSLELNKAKPGLVTVGPRFLSVIKIIHCLRKSFQILLANNLHCKLPFCLLITFTASFHFAC